MSDGKRLSLFYNLVMRNSLVDRDPRKLQGCGAMLDKIEDALLL